MNYKHQDIEKKWQERWRESGIDNASDHSDKESYYVLDMFAYPSGEGLHMGHARIYTASDVFARFKRLQGYNVMHPTGWDAFGLPAEQHAIKHKAQPAVIVRENTERFREQMQSLAFSYDWSREINTTDPEFYTWTQWAFLQMFKKGLAYESFEPINWCPSCLTGLANEDLEDGRCERCGSVVEKKPLRQWVLRITDYADRLLEDLDTIPWATAVKDAQRHWIGKSEGAELDFAVVDSTEKITVFTTRPDTLFGVTYVVVAPEHPLISALADRINNNEVVSRYIEAVKNKPELERTAEGKEKSGVVLEGIEVLNPINGERIPVWIADYVLADYGTGAVMAVPAHDERDYAFAQKYGLAIREAVIPSLVDKKNSPLEGKEFVERRTIHALVHNPVDDTYLLLDWKKHPWRNFVVGGVEEGEDIIEAARREVAEETGYTDLNFVKTLGGIIKSQYYAAHKDINRVAFTTGVLFELASDHRIEVATHEAEQHSAEWVRLEDMNEENMVCAELDLWKKRIAHDGPYIEEGLLYNSGDFSGRESSTVQRDITEAAGGRWVSKYKLRDWVFSRQRYWGEPIPLIHCEKCGVVAVPEAELPVRLPEVESYEPTGTGESPLAAIESWVNVPCPQCGGLGKRETNTMPQWAGSSWYYLRYLDPHNTKALVDSDKEKAWMPVDMYIGGNEHINRHLIYARFWHKFLYDIGTVSTIEPFTNLRTVGLILAADGRKMSKRWGNVVNPDEMAARYGADALRVYMMFIGPFAQPSAFKEEGVAAAANFIKRVFQLGEESRLPADSAQLSALLNRTIKKVAEDIESFRFNTAVSSLMILLNAMLDEGTTASSFDAFLSLLAPFAPHSAEELWHRGSRVDTPSIFAEKWPAYDPALLIDETVTMAVQVNGKLRDTIELESDADETTVKERVLALTKILPWIEGKEIVKVVVVKAKIVNIVVKE